VVARGLTTFLNTAAAPARAGDTLILYALGLGSVTSTPAAGEATRFPPLAELREQPVLRIGGVAVAVSFAGLTPGSVGLYQVQAVLPPNIPIGAEVPVTIEAGGLVSAELTIAIGR
jgi:uncharacterized protein (TIGR03437 family)